MAEIDDVIVANNMNSIRIFSEAGDCPSARELKDEVFCLPKGNLSEAATMMAEIADRLIKCAEPCKPRIDIEMGEHGAACTKIHIENGVRTVVVGWKYTVTVSAICEGEGHELKKKDKKKDKKKH